MRQERGFRERHLSFPLPTWFKGNTNPVHQSPQNPSTRFSLSKRIGSHVSDVLRIIAFIFNIRSTVTTRDLLHLLACGVNAEICGRFRHGVSFREFFDKYSTIKDFPKISLLWRQVGTPHRSSTNVTPYWFPLRQTIRMHIDLQIPGENLNNPCHPYTQPLVVLLLLRPVIWIVEFVCMQFDSCDTPHCMPASAKPPTLQYLPVRLVCGEDVCQVRSRGTRMTAVI